MLIPLFIFPVLCLVGIESAATETLLIVRDCAWRSAGPFTTGDVSVFDSHSTPIPDDKSNDSFTLGLCVIVQWHFIAKRNISLKQQTNGPCTSDIS
jgi:hypothetical protein